MKRWKNKNISCVLTPVNIPCVLGGGVSLINCILFHRFINYVLLCSLVYLHLIISFHDEDMFAFKLISKFTFIIFLKGNNRNTRFYWEGYIPLPFKNKHGFCALFPKPDYILIILPNFGNQNHANGIFPGWLKLTWTSPFIHHREEEFWHWEALTESDYPA